MGIRFFSSLVAAALLIAIASATFLALRDHWAPDLGAVYFGAKAFAMGQWDSVYAAPPVFFGTLIDDPVWLSAAEAQGIAGAPLVSFVYPPLVAVLLAPLVQSVTAAQFIAGGLALELAFLCLAVFFARAVAGARMSPLLWVIASLAIGLPTVALQNALFHAQPQIITTALVILAFALYRKEMDLPAGIVLAVAGAIKLTPLFLGILFLADRRWGAAIAAAGTSVGLAALAFAVTGPGLHFAFLDQIGRASASHLLSPLVYSAEGLLTALWGWIGGVPAELVPDKSFARLPSHTGIAVLCDFALILGSVMILSRTRWIAPDKALPLRLAGIWCLMAVFGPLGWAHYALGPLLLMPALLQVWPPRRALVFLVPVIAGLSLPTVWLQIWLLPGISLGSVVAVLSLLALPAAILLGIAQGSAGHDDRQA